MRCGGCAVQHIEDKYYRHWKTDLIRTALKNQDLTDIQFFREMKLIPRIAINKDGTMN